MARMAKMEIFLGPSSSQQSLYSGKKNWISTFFACVTGQKMSLSPNLPRNLVVLRHFLILLTFNQSAF